MVTYEQLLEAGVHFGHLTRKWNPAMAPYIFMERQNIHIIDLLKTQRMLEDACKAARQFARTGKKILFVGTKKQAKDILVDCATSVNMPYVTERWLGGMLTNFATVRNSVKKLQRLERMEQDGTVNLLQKKERLLIAREKEKLQKVLKGVIELNRLPGALYVVDIKKEHIAISEAMRLGIPTIAIVDTNSDPNLVDFPIPGNDDASKSIHIITQAITDAIKEGLAERKQEKEFEAPKREEDSLGEGKSAGEEEEREVEE
ncbi:MAG: 30S ribosomal protein S2 [Bacteroidia bacterium]|nr:30S ribosomal protein S2 [Bacteroidia bacterium]MDW8157577.1 30S ribosomal protein S2 [Bacteroidia bacterium]